MSSDTPILHDNLKKYIDSVGYNESDILMKNREETKELGSISIMQVGAAQGAFLSILCKVSKFQNCLEVGVFTGYSSLCIGTAIGDNAQLTVIDNNEEYLSIAQKYWSLAKIDKKINLINNDAIDALHDLKSGLKEKYDFAFIDADKSNYNEYYEIIITMMRSGGIICIDNTLWKGRVYDLDNSKSTQSIRDLNLRIKKDKRVEHSLLTIYDGMTMCYVK
ncbi:MAG: class I SAM-dependent methyltransferase [Pseudomonadota bacterium]|nr:class I SAM-dependent methyltransferase [Pseudomonadota bacterium]